MLFDYLQDFCVRKLCNHDKRVDIGNTYVQDLVCISLTLSLLKVLALYTLFMPYVTKVALLTWVIF